MHIVVFSLFGLLAGGLVRLMVPGPNRGTWSTSMGVGVLGAFAGGFLARALGWYGQGQIGGSLLSLAGALVLLAGYRNYGRRLWPL